MIKKIKSSFLKSKKLSKIYDIDINKLSVSKRELYGKKSFKYFTGCEDNNNIRPLYVNLPQITEYAKFFDDNKTMSFKISDKNLLTK